jgi:dihydroorotate dehydrogenase
VNQFLSQTTARLYSSVLKPIFFQMDPEFVHERMTQNGVWLGKISPLKQLIRTTWAYEDKKLRTKLNGITFPNPVGLSAGFDYNGELTQITPDLGFGFHTIGTVTLESYEGNPKPRLGRLPRSKALIVNKGLKNIGAREVIRHLENVTFEIPVGVSIASTNKAFKSDDDQIKNIYHCFQAFENSQVKHSYYELNISCPNTFGGEPFTTCARLDLLMSKIDKLFLSRPLYVKMPIDQSVAHTLALVKVISHHNAQGIIIGNLTKNKNNPAVDPQDQKIWQQRQGNLSGKPTWKVSNTLIRAVRDKYPNRLTIIGTGGIFSGEDAAYKMELGADLVQLITGMIFQGPQLIGQINQYLAQEV